MELDNPDWIGWVEIPDTGFSYPVMQRAGDWQYYMHRDFDGDYSFYGTPFLDWRCGPDSDNLIIYGHNINGGRMFGALHAYADEGYYKAHPQISLRIQREKHAYQVVSVLQADTASHVYTFTDTETGRTIRILSRRSCWGRPTGRGCRMKSKRRWKSSRTRSSSRSTSS